MYDVFASCLNCFKCNVQWICFLNCIKCNVQVNLEWWVNIMCLSSFYCVTTLYGVHYEWRLFILSSYMCRLRIHIFTNCIMYTHVIYACGYKGYIHSIHACEFKTVLNIFVFKQVIRNGMVASSKMLWKMRMI